MKQNQIRELAKKAGFTTGLTSDKKPWVWHLFVDDDNLLPELELFAKLVADAEREACVKACEQIKNELSNWPPAFAGVTAETKYIHAMGETIAQPFIEAIRERGQA